MIDGVTLFQGSIDDKHRHYLQNRFDFGSFFDIDSGAEIPIPSRKEREQAYVKMIWRRAFYRNLEIRLGWKYDKLTGKEFWHMKILGSIHKYYCNGDNSGVFTAVDAFSAINQISADLLLNKKKTKIVTLEIGINLPFTSAASYLDSNLVKRFKGTLFSNEGIGFFADLSHYGVKLYQKQNVLRYEVYYRDMQGLRKKFDIRNLSDLSPTLIDKMATHVLLEKCFKEIFLIDGIDLVTEKDRVDGMKYKDLVFLTRFSNDLYLKQLTARKEARKDLSNTLDRQNARKEKKFRQLVAQYGDHTTGKLEQAIRERIAYSESVTAIQINCPVFETGIKPKKRTVIINDKVSGESALDHEVNGNTGDLQLNSATRASSQHNKTYIRKRSKHTGKKRQKINTQNRRNKLVNYRQLQDYNIK